MECFLDNKYTATYRRIINRARIRVIPEGFTETHHIIPRSIGGTDDESNLVKLIPREHYLCHALLPKMVTGNAIHKMYAAFNMMHVDRYGNRYTSRLYEYYKVKFYKLHGENLKGKKRTLESRLKQGQTTKGKPWSEKARKVKRNKPTAKPVLVYRKDNGSFVGEWESISLCAKELNLDHSSVWKICKGDWTSKTPDGKDRPFKSHKGYTFRYKSED